MGGGKALVNAITVAPTAGRTDSLCTPVHALELHDGEFVAKALAGSERITAKTCVLAAASRSREWLRGTGENLARGAGDGPRIIS